MNFKTYLADKAFPNLFIWGLGYLAIEKAARHFFPWAIEKIDWSALLDWNSLACLVVGVAAVLVVGWLAAGPAAAPIFQAAREECSSAVTTLASIALVSGLDGLNPEYLVGAVFAYLIAWRLP